MQTYYNFIVNVTQSVNVIEYLKMFQFDSYPLSQIKKDFMIVT